MKIPWKTTLFFGIPLTLQTGIWSRQYYLDELGLKREQPDIFGHWSSMSAIVVRLKKLERRIQSHFVIRTILNYKLPKVPARILIEFESIIFEQYKEIYPIWKVNFCKESLLGYSFIEAESLLSAKSEIRPKEEKLVTDPVIAGLIQRYPIYRYGRPEFLIQAKEALIRGILTLEEFEKFMYKGEIIYSAGHLPFWISPVGQKLIDLYIKCGTGPGYMLRYPYDLQIYIAKNRSIQERIMKVPHLEETGYLFFVLLYFPEKLELLDQMNQPKDLRIFLTDKLSAWRLNFVEMICWEDLPWLPLMLRLLEFGLKLNYKEDNIFDIICSEPRYLKLYSGMSFKAFNEQYKLEKFKFENPDVIYSALANDKMTPVISNESKLELELQMWGSLKNCIVRTKFKSINWLFVKAVEILGLFPISRYIYMSNDEDELKFINTLICKYSKEQMAALSMDLDSAVSDFFGMNLFNLNFKFERKNFDCSVFLEKNLKLFLKSFYKQIKDPVKFYPAIMRKLRVVEDWSTYFMLTEFLSIILSLVSRGYFLQEINLLTTREISFNVMEEIQNDLPSFFNSLFNSLHRSENISEIHNYFKDWSEDINEWELQVNKLYKIFNPLKIFQFAIKDYRVFSRTRPFLSTLDFSNNFSVDILKVINLYANLN